MTVKMQQQTQVKKDALKPQTKELLSEEEKHSIDEMAELQKFFDENKVKEKQKKFDELKKLLAAVALDRVPATEKAVLKGYTGIVEFSEQSFPREITDMDKAIATMKEKVGGYEKLLPYIKITLGDIDSVLSEAEAAPFIGSKPGSRTLKSVRIKGE